MDVSKGFKAGDLVILSRPNFGQRNLIGENSEGVVRKDSEGRYTDVSFTKKNGGVLNFSCFTHRLDLANYSLINE